MNKYIGIFSQRLINKYSMLVIIPIIENIKILNIHIKRISINIYVSSRNINSKKVQLVNLFYFIFHYSLLASQSNLL